MTTQAFISLAADRVAPGPLVWVAGALQQRTELFMGDVCVCVLLVTFPVGSPEYERAFLLRTLDMQKSVPATAEGQVA